MRIGKPGVGQEGDKGLAGVFLELTAKGGAAHGAAFHGFCEHERLGELFEHPLHHVVETWAYGGIGFGKDTGLAECDRLLRRSVVKQCEEFQQQTCACELAGGGHAIEQVDGSSRGGRSKGNTAIRRGKESLDFALAAEPAERVFIWQMELKRVAIGAVLFHPAVRQMASKQHAVPFAERADVVANVPHSGSSLENGKLHLCVAVPAPANTLRGEAASSSFEGLQGPCINLPAQESQAFVGSEADVFEQDGHCPEIIAYNRGLSSAVRRSGQFLRRSSEIRHCFMEIIRKYAHTFLLL